jgi:hypothetical protein
LQQAEDKRKKAGFLLIVRGPLGEKHKAWGIGERLGTKHQKEGVRAQGAGRKAQGARRKEESYIIFYYNSCRSKLCLR